MTDILSQCRTCGAEDPYLFLPLGDHPPANSFVLPAETSAQLARESRLSGD